MARRAPLILITGASQGIGREIALVFARSLRGCRLVLVARNGKGLAQVARQCERAGAKPVTQVCDVTDAAAVQAMATAVLSGAGTPDVLINNAGLFRAAPLLETSVELFDQVVAANLRSVFLVSHAFLPAMVERGSGDVFNMSSIAGQDAYPQSSAYCAAKFGVTGLSRVMREEMKPHGIRVCCVHPGATWSPSWSGSGVDPERIMPAEDIAQAFFDVYRLGRRTVVEEITLRPQLGDL